MFRAKFIISTILTLLVSVVRADRVVFELDVSYWENKPNTVHVAGSFNGWNKESNPLRLEADRQLWKTEIDLPEGVHYYKFVIDGQRWIEDPKADPELSVDDTFGGKNSGIWVGPDARKFPEPQPNLINGEGLIHHPDQLADANVVDEKTLRLRVRAQQKDVETVQVIFVNAPDRSPVELHRLESRMGFDSYGGVVEVTKAPARYIFEFKDGTRTVYLTAGGVENDLKNASKRPFEVAMKVGLMTPEWARHAVWYQIFPERFRNGDPSNDPGENWYETLLPWTSEWFAAHSSEAPGIDNFYNGYGNVWRRRYGGDIQGVKEKLAYLRSLGVTAIYFNPVFEAESMHKYDTADFRHIDDNFGKKDDNEVAVLPQKVPPIVQQQRARLGMPPLADTPAAPKPQLYELDGTPVSPDHVETDDPATWKWTKSDLIFLDFIQEARKNGIRVCIDGVFNHTGRMHPFFQDVVKNGRNSKYADWFEIEAFPDTLPADPEMFGKDGGLKFKAWDGPSGHLPVFRKDPVRGLAPGPYEHVMAITRRWLAPGGDPSKGVDGIRLDVANDIPHPFWRDWRKVVKQTKPDAYISGEIWSEATPWINDGDQFDAVMNYQFAMAVQDFFVDQSTAITPSQFNQRLVRLCYVYPFQAALVMMNLFDSHDTDRAPSMYVNPDRPYDGSNRIQDNGPDYSPRKPNETEWTRFQQAVAFQMSFVGAPMIYYGDESGMWSPDDPSNRMPMLWEDLQPYENPEMVFKKDLFDFYRRSVATRHQLQPLRIGEYYPVRVDDAAGVLVFARRSGNQTVYVVLNRSNQTHQITFDVSESQAGKTFVNYLDPEQVLMRDADPLDPSSRTTLQVNTDAPGLTAEGTRLTVTLPSFKTAILAEK